jgi:hypothetical protein
MGNRFKALAYRVGQFRSGPGTNPYNGTVGVLEHIEEDRVEVRVNDNGEYAELKEAITELKKVIMSLTELGGNGIELTCWTDRYTLTKRLHTTFTVWKTFELRSSPTKWPLNLK